MCISILRKTFLRAAAASAAATAASAAVVASALCLSILPASGAAKTRALATATAAGPSCAVLLDSLDRLYAENQPDFLAWDFPTMGCDKTQLYRGLFRQGLGFSMVSAWTEAAHILSLAKEAGGDRDEDVLFHLWNAYRHLDLPKEAAVAARELLARYPASPFLPRIRDEWEQDRKPRSREWRGSFESRFVRSRVVLLDNVHSNRMKGEISQSAGNHGFREYGTLSLKSRLGGNILDGVQVNLGGEWSRGEFALEAEWGLGYDAGNAKDTVVGGLSGSGSGARYAGWNGSMGQLALGWMRRTGEGMGLGARADVRLLSRDWWAAGASLSPSWFAGAWSVTGLLDLHRHGMDWRFGQSDTLGGEPIGLTFILNEMQTLQASVSPGYRLKRHDLGLGLGYYLVRTGSVFRIDYGGLVDDRPSASYEHSLAMGPSYRYTWRKGLRFNLGLNFGYDFDERPSTTASCREWLPGYCADESYSADAGFSLSF